MPLSSSILAPITSPEGWGRARKFTGIIFESTLSGRFDAGSKWPAIWGWRGFYAGNDGSNYVTTGDGYAIGPASDGPLWFTLTDYPGITNPSGICQFPILPLEWGLWRDHSGGASSEWPGGTLLQKTTIETEFTEVYQMSIQEGNPDADIEPMSIVSFERLYHNASVKIRVDEYKIAHLITDGNDVPTVTLDASYNFNIPANVTINDDGYTAPTSDPTPDPIIEGSAWNSYAVLVKITIP